MKHCLLTLLFCCFTLECWGEDKTGVVEGKEKLNFPNPDVLDVLEFYHRRVGKPVFVALDIQGGVTIEHPGLTKNETLEVIRKTLLEQCGISIRETSEGNLLAGWSKDPKFPLRRDPPMTEAERAALPKPADRTAEIKMRRRDVREVLRYYSKAVKKPVFLAVGVHAVVTVEHFGLRDEIPDVISKALLEKYGVEMRVTSDGDLLFQWSKDPKYPRHSDPPPTEADREKSRVFTPTTPRRRLRFTTPPNP